MADSPQPRQIVSLLSGDRPMPHNTEAEVAVLGSVLLDPANGLATAAGMLNFAGSFYHPQHQVIFRTVLELNNEQAHGSMDIVTLSHALQKKGKLEEVGGQAYLLKLLNSVPSAANIEHYADIVHQNALLRKLISKCTEIVERCFDPQETVKELADGIESEIMSITNLRDSHDIMAIGEKILPAIDYIDKLRHKDRGVTGLSTGYEMLDRLIMGLRGGEMFVLAARPSIGKTALALNIAENIALGDSPVPVGIFSLEMSTQQLVLRMLCSRARINLADIRDCALSKGRWEQIMQVGQILKQAPIYIDDAVATLDIVELRARARRMKREHDIGVLIIDYLQLLRPVGGNRNTTRENEVSAISGGIKSLSKELEIPVVVLAQLNRQAAQQGQKPRLSHLRESGAIEQDADVVALLHRERETETETYSNPQAGIEAELIIAKHRNGQTGRVPLVFIPAYTRFEKRSPVADEDVPET